MAVQFIFPPPFAQSKSRTPAIPLRKIPSSTPRDMISSDGRHEEAAGARGSGNDPSLPDPRQAGTGAPRHRGEPLHAPAGPGHREQDPEPPAAAEARDGGIRLRHLLPAGGGGRRRLLRLSPHGGRQNGS